MGIQHLAYKQLQTQKTDEAAPIAGAASLL